MTDETRVKKILAIEDPARRYCALCGFTLRIGWHGSAWYRAMNEIKRMNADGWRFRIEGNKLFAVQEKGG